MTAPFDELRERCLALPGVTERLSHGEAAWFAPNGREFVTTADRHHDDRVAFWCVAPPGEQQGLVSAAPDRFFVPPYVGVRGWLGVYVDVPVDWDEVGPLVDQAYRVVTAPRPRKREAA